MRCYQLTGLHSRRSRRRREERAKVPVFKAKTLRYQIERLPAYGATGTVWFDDVRLFEGVAVRRQVFARQSAKALVLVKPYVGGSFGDDTATVHKLPGAFRPLRADGTVSDAVREVVLRNAEAAVLLK